MIHRSIYCEWLVVTILVTGASIRDCSASGSCWLKEDECYVKAEIFQNLEFLNGVPMQIDCRVGNDTETTEAIEVLKSGSEDHHHDQHTMSASSAYLFSRRFMGIQSVMLDGCQTPVNTHTYGLEFLPICANVTKVSLQHFHLDALMPLQCVSAEPLNLEYLTVQHNEIVSADGDSFNANYPHLRVLELESNKMQIMQGNSFRSLRSLEHLRIVSEPLLELKAQDIFAYTTVTSIHLEAMKQVTSEVFRHLPETVEILYVAYTQLYNGFVEVINARALANLTITNCGLERFSLVDIHSTVKSVNLNGNALKSFYAHENKLKELDLSNNQLEYFDYQWTMNLTNLEVLSLKENYIKIMNMYEILKAIPNARYVDVRGNRLEVLQEDDDEFPFWVTTQLRIRCDNNPWNCLWLHDFAHLHPEKFRILQYEKFISKINVNGLQCIPAEKPKELKSLKMTNNVTTTPTHPNKSMNMSTYHLVYGDPYDFRRNQRAEALIIVFMLPVGIAFLFLLLYMWIYCQKMFHVSYYKNFSCVCRQPNAPNTTQRFDVVRQIPPHLQLADCPRALTAIHEQEDRCYEVPLNGLCSDCNCKSMPNATGMCNKAIHITYEEPPGEATHKIYEEIISLTENELASQAEGTSKNASHHAHYDHLRFE